MPKPTNPPLAAPLPSPVRAAGWTGRDVLLAVALLLMTIAVYAPLREAGYIWDDDDYVTHNDTLRSAEGLRRIWFEPLSIPQYYPLVHTTFWIEYHLWGLTPLGYHLVNVLLHGASAILLWRLLRRLAVPGAWLAAAIFAVHPVMVESVAWVTERKNVLSLTLALLSLHAYLRFAPVENDDADAAAEKSVRWRWYVLSLVLLMAALLSKTVVASLPAVILVIEWWKRGRINGRDVAPLAPFFAIGAGLGLVTAWLERHHVGPFGPEWDFTPADRVLIAGRGVWFYAAKLLWPHPLIFFYPRWQIDDSAWWQYLFPAGALALVVVLYVWRKQWGRGPLAAALIFGGVLLPALGFVNVYPMRYSFVADHFQYHASIALVVLFAAGVGLLAARLPSPSKNIVIPAVVVGLATLSLLTAVRTRIYFDQEILYRDTIANNPECVAAFTNLSTYLASAGRLKDSVEIARDGVGRFPTDAGIHNNLAAALLRRGDREGFQPGELDEAIAQLHAALQLKPGDAKSETYLGSALVASQRYDQARQHFAHALEVSPRSADALHGMGSVLVAEGKFAEAAGYFAQALEADPTMARAHYSLAILQLGEGHKAEGVQHLQAALAVDPQMPDAHYALAGELAGAGDLRAAADHYSAAIAARPTFARARNNLGVVLMNLGETDRAIPQFEEAVRVDPSYAEAAANLQKALTVKQQGQPKSPPAP